MIGPLLNEKEVRMRNQINEHGKCVIERLKKIK